MFGALFCILATSANAIDDGPYTEITEINSYCIAVTIPNQYESTESAGWLRQTLPDAWSLYFSTIDEIVYPGTLLELQTQDAIGLPTSIRFKVFGTTENGYLLEAWSYAEDGNQNHNLHKLINRDIYIALAKTAPDRARLTVLADRFYFDLWLGLTWLWPKADTADCQ